MDKIQLQSRRDFLKLCSEGLAGIAIIGFIAPVINSCANATDSGPDIAAFNITVDVSSLSANNQGLRTNTPDGHVLLVVRQSTTIYVSILLVCTHEGCGGSNMQQSGNTITCSCHGSQFNLSGHVTHGPASSDLTTFPTVFDSATMKVTIHN